MATPKLGAYNITQVAAPCFGQLVGASAPLCLGLTTGPLECPHNMAASGPRMGGLRQQGKTSFSDGSALSFHNTLMVFFVEGDYAGV